MRFAKKIHTPTAVVTLISKADMLYDDLRQLPPRQARHAHITCVTKAMQQFTPFGVSTAGLVAM